MFLMISKMVSSLSSKPQNSENAGQITRDGWLDDAAALVIWVLTGRKV
jgi:hypothetical protein